MTIDVQKLSEVVDALVNTLRSLQLEDTKLLILIEKLDTLAHANILKLAELYKKNIQAHRSLIDNKKYDEIIKVKFQQTEDFNANDLIRAMNYTNTRQKNMVFNMLIKINKLVIDDA